MAEPPKKTEYRLMTLAELRREADRRIYQASKLRAEYEDRGRQTAQQAAAWARRTGAGIETGARQALSAGEARARAAGQSIQRAADRAAQEGERLQSQAATSARRGAAIVGARLDEARRAAAQAADQAVALRDRARETIEKAPSAVAQGVHDLWLSDIRDDQKYFRQLNDYERARLYRDQGITDPASAEARQVEQNELLLRGQAFDARKAEWDAYPEWRKLAMSVGYGGEEGAFKGGAQMLRAYERGGRKRFDEFYQAEQLPHTFARQEHPVAYLASNVVGGLASDALLARTTPYLALGAEAAGSFGEGYFSEPGDIPTRAMNGAINVLGDEVAHGLARPIEKYAGKRLRKLIGIAPALEPTVPARRIDVKPSPDEASFKAAGKAGDVLVEDGVSAGVDEAIDRAKDWREAQIERNRKARAAAPARGSSPARP